MDVGKKIIFLSTLEKRYFERSYDQTWNVFVWIVFASVRVAVCSIDCSWSLLPPPSPAASWASWGTRSWSWQPPEGAGRWSRGAVRRWGPDRAGTRRSQEQESSWSADTPGAETSSFMNYPDIGIIFDKTHCIFCHHFLCRLGEENIWL